jgi:hypothetical protein
MGKDKPPVKSQEFGGGQAIDFKGEKRRFETISTTYKSFVE